MRRLCAAVVLLWSLPAGARAARSVACIDSFGTVIEGVESPGACKNLGARWGKPGTKSLPKETSDAKPSKHASNKSSHHRGRSSRLASE